MFNQQNLDMEHSKNRKKRIFLIIGFSVVSQITVAQWKFNVSLSVNGCSGFDKVTENWANAQLKQWNATLIGGFPTKGECENARSIVISSSVTDGKCKVQFTASPCVGSGGAVGNVDVLGVSKGGSFNSTNPVNEINDWSNDDMERMLALNLEYKSSTPVDLSMGEAESDQLRSQLRRSATFTIDPNKPFVSTNMREGGSSTIISEDLIPLKERPADFNAVNDYLTRIEKNGIPQFDTAEDFIQWVKNKFFEVSGFNVDVIAGKFEKSEEELKALANYREVYNQLMNKTYDIDALIWKDNHSEERKAYEMAVLMDDCYKDSEHEYISQTNYREMNTNDFADDDPMKKLSNVIDAFDGIAGFHAEIYYNKELDEYTIAFEGSQFHLIDEPVDFIKDWFATNLYQGIGGVPAQYQMAAYIASNLPQDIKINFAGHSLGGGLASVAGAISGRPTYTFNAEGINDNVIRTFELGNRKSFDNIKAYQANNDMLTFFQEGGGKKSLEYALNPLTTFPQSAKPIVSNYIAASSVGDKKIVNSGGWHTRKPMVNYFANEWGRSVHTLTVLNNERSKTRMQTVGSIQINLQ